MINTMEKFTKIQNLKLFKDFFLIHNKTKNMN